jgi:hypothetical protein
MPFVGPVSPTDPKVPKTLDWSAPGHTLCTFFFTDPTLASTVRYRLAPNSLSALAIKGFIGDQNLQDDIALLESFKPVLQQASPANRFLSVVLMPRERQGKPFTFFLSFFSDQTDLENQDYQFQSDGKPIGLQIPVRFVR